jgi:hypothetical protein
MRPRARWAAALLACAGCNAVFGLDPLTYEEPTRPAPALDADANATDATDATADASPEGGAADAGADSSPE